ncbi:MAG: hypothetical protein K2Q97_00205 [Burkholderiaceae bacterium]|nr:hypothetical protein [Burkholderiaceae bacterium]
MQAAESALQAAVQHLHAALHQTAAAIRCSHCASRGEQQAQEGSQFENTGLLHSEILVGKTLKIKEKTGALGSRTQGLNAVTGTSYPGGVHNE